MNLVPGADNREIRIFLSSTFRDMDAERNYLLQHVFPRFRQECAQRNVGFTEIDLRWGITEQASQNGRTVEICLSEIDRCREYPPFFIGFLGERYGWVPAEADLDAYWGAHHKPLYAAAIRAALGRGISVTELEMRFGVLDHLDTPLAVNAHFFLRDAGLSARLANGAPRADFYDDGAGKLDALKQALRDSGKVALDGYVSVEQFGEAIYQRLVEGLDQRYPAAQVPGPLQQRAEEHARFAASRRLNYVPLPAMRAAVAQAIAASAASAPQRIYLGGPSGIGKSALMTDLAAWLPQQFPGAAMYARYSGADGSRELGQWRDDLLVQLAPDAVLTVSDADRWQALFGALERDGAAHERPLLLLLDAVDQLDDAAQVLATLARQEWPPHVTLLVSGLPHLQPANGYTIVPVQAPDPALRADIIAAFTSGYRKALAPALVATLSASEAAASPLFLRMVLEELRVRSHHETLSADIAALLALAQPDALFAHLLQRWDQAYSDAGHPAIVSALAGLLSLSHSGLSEAELADLLASPYDPVSPETGKPRLPAAQLSPLLGVLRPYLLRNAGREVLMHQALQRGALPPAQGAVRQILIRHFGNWHWRHVTERLFQRLQLAREAAPADTSALVALEHEVRDLGTFFYLPHQQYGLMRDSLQLLGAASAAPDTPAARLGLGWGAQLDTLAPQSWQQKSVSWLRRKAGQEMPTRLHVANHMVHQLTWWAYYTVATPLAEHLVALLEARGEEPAKLADANSNLATLYMERGHLELATKQFEKLLEAERCTPTATESDRTALTINLASLYVRLGANDQALPLAQEGVRRARETQPYHAGHMASALEVLGTVELNLGDLAQSVQTLEQAQAMASRALPAGDLAQLTKTINRAQAYLLASRCDEAETLFREVLATCRAELTPGHPVTAMCLTRLGALCLQLDRYDEAESLMLEALASHRASYGGQHGEIVTDLMHLGDLYQLQERYAESEACLQEAVTMVREYNTGDRLTLLRGLTLMSRAQAGLLDYAGAERSCLEARSLAEADLPPTHRDYATVLASLGSVYKQAGQAARAEPLLVQALALRRNSLPAGHQDIGGNLEMLAEVYLELRRVDEAEPLLLEALSISEGISASALSATGVMWLNLGAVYALQQRVDEAEAAFLKALDNLRMTTGAGLEALANALVMVCNFYGSLGRWDESHAAGVEALAMFEGLRTDTTARRFGCLHMLAQAPQAPQSAMQLLEQALPLARQLLPGTGPHLSQLLRDAADLSRELGRAADGDAWLLEDVAYWRALAAADVAGKLQLAGALYWLGSHRQKTRQAVRAIAPLEEALALYRAHGAPDGDERMLMMTVFCLADSYLGSQVKIGVAMALKQEGQAIIARLPG